MASGGASFPYSSLEPTTQEIRLLTFTYPTSTNPQPTLSQPLETCTLTLTHHALSSSLTIPRPKYHALSYVWGLPAPTHPLTVSGHALQVPHNLHAALSRLARQRFEGRLWIDALCINQRDTAEKNWQVGMMSTVYRMAEGVVVWLGEDDEYGLGGRGLRMAGELGALFKGHVRRYAGNGNVDGRMDGARIEGFVRTVREFVVTRGWMGERVKGDGTVGFDFEAIWKVFAERPWWRRVWILQEVVLARQAVMLCGADPEQNTPVAWDDVRECIRLFEWMVLYPSTAPEHHRLYEILGDIYPNVSHLALVSDGYRRSLEEASKTADSSEDGGMSLLDTIIWTSLALAPGSSIQATDPRDRIYGLLGVVHCQDRQKIPVDYSPDMTLNKTLFCDAKALLLQHGPNILSFCQRSLPSSNNGLPSWVPDWTAPRITVLGGVFFGDEADAKKRGDASRVPWSDWASKCRIEDAVYEDPVVSLQGAVVGRIEKVGREFHTASGSSNNLNECREWLLELQEMVKERGVPGIAHSELDELWRVPMADFGLAGRADAEDSSRFRRGFDV
ncbi:hypothetical protein VTI74DRAFT_7225 [Chaetomium olivicolor]